jgi:hypothetical protein
MKYTDNYRINKSIVGLIVFLFSFVILIVFVALHRHTEASICKVEWIIWFEEGDGFHFRYNTDFNWKEANCSTAFLPIEGMESSDVRYITDKSGSLKATLILGLDSVSNQGFISWFTCVPLRIKIKDKFQESDVLSIDAGDVSPDCGIRTFVVIKDGESFKLIPNSTKTSFIERKL